MYWKDRISNAKAKQLKKYLLFPCCAKNICQYLDSVVHTNNWESRHNFLALEKVNSRGLRISFALFPELINNEHTEYFTGIQREYFK